MRNEADGPHERDFDDGLFIVKHGEGDDARYAICQRLTSVRGDHRIPGSRSCVADLVSEQGLLAAFLSASDCGCDGLRAMTFEPQSSRNVTINIQL